MESLARIYKFENRVKSTKNNEGFLAIIKSIPDFQQAKVSERIKK